MLFPKCRRKHSPSIFVAGAVVFFLCGCSNLATRMGHYKPITAAYERGDYSSAAAIIDSLKNKFSAKDRLLYYVDSGLLHHYAGNYDSSNVRLSMAENAAEELFTKSLSRAAVSMILNDNALEYSGEDYEILYAGLIKALNYINLGDHDGAFVEIRRTHERLQYLEQKYVDAAAKLRMAASANQPMPEPDYQSLKIRFHESAFARYLSMHMFAAEGKYDDARIDSIHLDSAFVKQPHIYPFAMPPVKYHSDSLAILSVVALIGVAPIKLPLNLRVRADKDLDLLMVLYTDEKNMESEYGHMAFPIDKDFYFKFAIPRMKAKPSSITEIKVIANNQLIGNLNLLESVSKVASETFEAKKNLIYFRSLLRTITKGLVTHRLKESVDDGGAIGWLKKAAIDIGAEISENADLRCSKFLPDGIMIGDFEVPPGLYDIKIQFCDSEGAIIGEQLIPQFVVRRNRFNIIESYNRN